MTTFTLQDLTPEQQTAVNNHEEIHKMFNDMGTALTQPTTTDILNSIAIPQPPLNAPEPQPSLEQILKTIGEQFTLLSTVISSSQPKTNAENAGENSLQECVEMVLRQGAWFDDKVADAIDEDVVSDAVKDHVETEVEYYFNNNFSPEDHFDFHDAISDCVDDRLDDIVRDKLDDVVSEQLEELVAEKLKNIRVVFD